MLLKFITLIISIVVAMKNKTNLFTPRYVVFLVEKSSRLYLHFPNNVPGG